MLQLVSTYDLKARSVSHGSDPGSKMCCCSRQLAEFPGLTSLEFALSVNDWIFTDRSKV